jgi:hypothetical protein
MALIVEDGTGKVDAESYVTVAGADTYHSSLGAPAAWTASTETQKEQALRKATSFIDEHFGSSFKGRRTNESQRLRWPRIGASDSDGYLISSSAIPRRLSDATAELAAKAREDGDLFADADTSGELVAEEIKVGPISISEEYSGSKGSQKLYKRAEALLGDLIEATVWERA